MIFFKESVLLFSIVAQIETYISIQYLYTGLESQRFKTRLTSEFGPSTGLQKKKVEKVPPGYGIREKGETST